MTAPPSPSSIAAIIVAAGQGLRAGQPLPKQFALWRGKPLVRHSAEAFAAFGIAPIIVAMPAGCEQLAAAAVAGVPGVQLIIGGKTRQETVQLALAALGAQPPERVLIHDAARPALNGAIIARLLAALDHNPAAIPVLPVIDSLVQAAGDTMAAPADRALLRRVQTPQAFHYGEIVAAQQSWTGPLDAGDDAQVAHAAGLHVVMVEGDEALHKLTYAADFAADLPPIRVGMGYDVHRLVDGEELWLCGIKLDAPRGLAGHSDADVAIHALVDAVLGAVGAGDIGDHFPPSDPQWRGAASHQFLSHAAGLAAQHGYRIGNVDVTIICEAPKIGPHRDAMRARLAAILDIPISAVSVKATTTERLGFTGRSEGIAAQAAATLLRI